MTRSRHSAPRLFVHVPGVQKLMRTICRNGFEHHAAMNGSHCSAAVAEALGNYLGWDVYHHNAEIVSRTLHLREN